MSARDDALPPATTSWSSLGLLRETMITAPSLKTTLLDIVEFWPGIWVECRRLGLLWSIPELTFGVIVTVSMLLLALAGHVWKFFDIVLLPVVVPWSSYHKGRREARRRDHEFATRFLTRPGGVTLSPRLTRPGPSAVALFRLPLEIRRQILVEAFGDRTLHMHLAFQHPFRLAGALPATTPPPSNHARIQTGAFPGLGLSYVDRTQARQWTWFGCVCHRLPTTGKALSLGRRRGSWGRGRGRGHGSPVVLEPNMDFCLEGAAACGEWPGKWPGKCQIGIMGWLLTCRQAYRDGMEILYRTNTIHMSSAPLLRYLPDIVTPTVVSHLTSLELVWNPDEVPLDLGFTGATTPSKASPPESSVTHRRPLFPSMQVFRLTFTNLMRGGMDAVSGQGLTTPTGQVLTHRLQTRLLPVLDALLARCVPPSADVTLSCPEWSWYQALDLELAYEQGVAATRHRRADIGGLKCWRQTPGAQVADQQLEEGEGAARDGFWIHVARQDVNLGQGKQYDWRRDALYRLGEVRDLYPIT